MSAYEIVNALHGLELVGERSRWVDWFDHGGWSDFGGTPAIVGEPYAAAADALDAAAELQTIFGCPVTYNRLDHHGTGC